jgi:hypothetical protein
MKSLFMRSSLILLCLFITAAVRGQTQSPQAPVASSSGVASTVVPRLIKHGGTLLDEQGQAMKSPVGVTFALYSQEFGGAALWMETQNVATDAKGNYTVLLGANSALGVSAELFNSGEARWLGVQVEREAERPRVLLVSVPYALKAGDAQTLGGKPLSAFQMAVAGSSGTGSNNAVSNAPQASVTEQANEITCSSGSACSATFIPQFNTNGGSSTVANSIMKQSGTNVLVSGSLSATSTIHSANTISASKNITAGGTVSGAAGSFSGNTSGPDVVVRNSGSGDGMDITAASGTGNGLAVTNTVTQGVGVLSTSFLPFVGHSSGSIGVLGVVNTDSDFLPAVYGIQFGATKRTFGVDGYNGSTEGAGVFGFHIGNSAVGSGLAGAAGVWGDTSQTGGVGLRGSADDGFAVVGANNSLDPTAFFDNTTTNPSGLVFETSADHFPAGCTIDVNANLFCTGTKSAVVPVNGGARKVALYAIEGPENWFEDAGSGQLSNGEVVVNLESVFGETVNTDINYRVFLTPNGDCRGLYVAQKTPTSFVVRELGGGTSSIAFDYRILAKRKGYESIRLADKTEVFNRKNAAMRRSQSPFSKMPDPLEIQKLIQAHAPVAPPAQPASPR